MPRPFLSGVVEGFYGREWDWSARLAYADFLQQQGLNSYLYCPKGDACLRKQWREAWPTGTLKQLSGLARHYRDKGLNWGVGLSPYALYQDYSPADRRALQRKIEQINDLGGRLLAILFDDMPGDCPDLAARQAEIIGDVVHWSSADRLLACPTYYSYDPVLETHFGAKPQDYWERLGREVPVEVDLLWTGNLVVPAQVEASDISGIAELLGRAPVLWDNYPVNDGARASRYLHLQPLPGRDPELANCLAGHFCNPMNQAWLSRYPLAGLAQLYGGEAPRPEDFFSAELSAALLSDREAFEQRGLDELDSAERAELAERYRQFDEPAAMEIVDWLQEKYLFDPDCLTA